MLRFIRYLLFPFALLYLAIVYVRNKLYDKRILKSVQFDVPMIGVGNLSVGGTGKTPMVEYLIRLLQDEYEVAMLSRGYRRRTKGFLIAQPDSTAADIGDEPMQLHHKFDKLTVSVGADRVMSTIGLMGIRPETEVILLDDAFQHRAIRPHLQIVLTPCYQLFVDDWYLPTGDLRDLKSSYRRADVLVVTKCATDLPNAEKASIVERLKPLPHQKVFFSHIQYGLPYDFLNPTETVSLSADMSVLLVCGIANSKSLVEYLKSLGITWQRIPFADHHYFKEKELERVATTFEKMTASNKIILTTEKDSMRLLLHEDFLRQKGLPIYCLPIEMGIQENGADFDRLVKAKILEVKNNDD